MKQYSLTDFLERRLPPGTGIGAGVCTFSVTMGLALLRSLLYFSDLSNSLTHVCETTLSGERILRPGAVMPTFASIMHGTMIGFTFTAAVMLILAIRYYLTFYHGGRSIYLMRRLPDRWELFRRTLTLPLLGIVTAGAASLLLCRLFYAVYMAVTPAECLPAVPGGSLLPAWFSL